MPHTIIKNPSIHSSWWLYLLLAISYFVSGQALSAIFSQSQIVPIWLPAGIALVGCYLWWWRFFPAVFVASVLFNFSFHSEQQLALVNVDVYFEALTIALGATLQAAIGAGLLKFWLGNPLSLISYKRVIGFIVLVGILVTLTSANIGVYALSQFSTSYSVENHWSNVFMWWMGDSLGILIATPFILSLLSIKNLKLQILKSRFLVLAICSLLFVSVTLATVLFSKHNYENGLALANRELQVIENALQREISNNQYQLQTLASFVQSTPELTRAEFLQFTDKLIHQQSAIKAMSWNPVISVKDREAFSRQMSEEYQRPINIVGDPLSQDDSLVVVQFISPEQDNETAIGFNIYSNPARKSVLNSQAGEYQLLATPIIQLVQSEKAEPAYLLFAPVYSWNLGKDKTDVNTKEIRGYATGVFLTENMLDTALQSALVDIFLYELHEKGSDVVFSSNTQVNMKSLTDSANLTTINLEISGQNWQMDLVPKQAFLIDYQSDLAMLLYIFQIVVVAFSITLILLINNRQTVLQFLVHERTKALAEAKQEADNANLAKSQFLANMSHELRTPLNAVVGFSLLAKKSDDVYVLKSYIDKIVGSSKNLLAIVNDILDISKIESEKLVLEREPFDMHALLDDINTMFESAAQNKQINWLVSKELPLDCWFIGDSLRIQQILLNLCANAVKFTDEGGVSLTAKITHVSKNATGAEIAQLTFKVIDSGIGIAKEDQLKLFSAFSQADNSTTRKFGGTGLGLAISKELCHLMHGHIAISSAPKKGSEFMLSLPLEVCLPSSDSDLETLTNVSALAGKRILVAEDNEINQLVITEILKSFGINVVVVENGQLAIEAAALHSFDLILMDCQMPVLDGYEATIQIRKLPGLQNLPIIALTADVTQESKFKAAQIGFNDHLGKPIDIEKLSTSLLKHISSD